MTTLWDPLTGRVDVTPPNEPCGGPTVTGAACPKFPMEVTGGKPVGAIGRLKFDVDAISFCF
ncbi:MAG: hypothetical protein CL961_00165 [Euryarchaeota archaeon]|nr:hypothetical protein [Euryarchaeota archaeon]